MNASTGHNLGAITGNGRILIPVDASGNDYSPAGNTDSFADAVNGETVVLYGDGILLDEAARLISSYWDG